MLAAARNVMKQCLAVKPGESILIVTDPTRRLLAGIFETAAKEITAKVDVAVVSGMTGNAQESPQSVADKMLKADVALLITTYSLSHTQARKQACAAGCRIASMPGITLDMIQRTLLADYSQIATLSDKLARILTDGQTAKLTSPAGTNLQLALGNRLGESDNGLYTQAGSFGNLPAGEACIGPLEGQTRGILVIDGAIADITLAKLSPNVLEAEKVFGTCHVTLGSNISYGGKVDVPFHSDGIVLQPTLQIDGKIIIKAGKFLL